MGDYDALEAAICADTRLLFSETPTNPYLRILDLERFVNVARRHGLLTVVDATFASPVNQRPLEWGVDVVVHSATKYLAGHNDLLAGVVLGDAETVAFIRETVNTLGCIVDPHNAYLLLRGLKTLGLRVRQQNQTGLLVAKFLESHPAVERVWYPGLPSHPEYELAATQMDGFGGVVSFNIRGDYSLTARFVDLLKLPYISPSLGGVESLVTQPALMTYGDYSPEERKRLGIEDNLVRLAVGVEDPQDILADLDQALRQVWQPEHSPFAEEISYLQESPV